MASKGKCFQLLSKLFVLLNFMTLQVHTIETVNLVDFCGQTIRRDGMIVNSHRESRKYYFVTMGTDCHLTMQATSPKDKVQFYFRFFLVYSLLRVNQPTTQPLPTPSMAPLSANPTKRPPTLPTPAEEAADPCKLGSYVQFYDGKDRNAQPIGAPLCGKSLPRPILSTGNYLTLRLVTRGQQPRVDFVGDFTSFRLGFNQSKCSGEPYFPCHNGKCIPMSLVCDGKDLDNCGDGSDQSSLPPAKCKGPFSTAPDKLDATTRTPPSSPSHFPSPTSQTCSTQSHGNMPQPDSITDNKRHVSLLALYIALGVIGGVVLLFWCCWSPGWFVWRVSACRFMPCCNSFCASCQLCTRSCSRKDHRLAKVTPQSTATVAM
ncbi:low-density lipoprotein receptor class A domain-containing protein 2 [Acipenser ruthenus]|uniref:low-density lipoprotein receptor class A domain-containing protein 2 n=1 Tax=Acipenser ruthenus TaxID=7906 RepID=UPI002741E360|nr:low-density lipoprotein receptor class A domain-containing protein 2 [Acipenser ruthenus]